MLYEVITYIVDVVGIEDNQNPVAYIFRHGAVFFVKFNRPISIKKHIFFGHGVGIKNRITSYNVCYTKLLRSEILGRIIAENIEITGGVISLRLKSEGYGTERSIV